MDGYNSIRCVQKLMEIETVKNATETAAKLYIQVKGSNRLITLYFVTIEKSFSIVANGLEPVVKKLEKPIKIADNYACDILEGSQTIAVIMESPRNILKNSCMCVMKTGLAQTLMTAAEKILYTAELSVTLLPEISVVDVDTDDKDKETTVSVVENVLGNIKKIYGVATTPLQVTSRVLRASRQTIKNLKNEASGQNETSTEVSERKYQKRSLLGRLFHLPVKGFHYIGVLAEQRAILNKQWDPNYRVPPEVCNQQLEEVERQWIALEQAQVEMSTTSSESEDEDADYSTPLSARSPVAATTPRTEPMPESEKVASE